MRRVARDPLTPGAVAGPLLVIAALVAWAALEVGDPLVVAVTRQRAGGEVLDSPAWHPSRMGPQARAAMGWDGDTPAAAQPPP